MDGVAVRVVDVDRARVRLVKASRIAVPRVGAEREGAAAALEVLVGAPAVRDDLCFF